MPKAFLSGCPGQLEVGERKCGTEDPSSLPRPEDSNFSLTEWKLQPDSRLAWPDSCPAARAAHACALPFPQPAGKGTFEPQRCGRVGAAPGRVNCYAHF